jgi:putative N-acetylmannosamine-6-phosphate epimerase
MKSKSFLFTFSALIILLFTTCNSKAQNTKQSLNNTSSTTIEVIQFHSQHRCMTCNKIEEFTKETLKNHPSISFSLINVDDKKNNKKATAFEAAGTALFLYNSTTGKKKDLTDFAFMNARNKEKFTKGLHDAIKEFEK